MLILIAEDDLDIGDTLTKFLLGEGYRVVWVRSGRRAADLLAQERFDCVVLDLNLPELSGYEVLQRLRRKHPSLPVLIVSVRDAPEERAQGLDLGADDYLAKPFELVEFGARLRSIVRRSGGAAAPVVFHGRLRLRRDTGEAWLDDRAMNLGLREFRILEALVLRAGSILRKDQLIHLLSGPRNEVSANLVEVYIHRLRRILESADIQVRTIRGVGYSLCAQESSWRDEN